MAKREHTRELIATLKNEWGRLSRGGIVPSADNRACLLYFGGEEAGGELEEELDPSLTVKEAVAAAQEALKECLVFNGRIVAESEGPGFFHHEVLRALSFDGRKLAIGRMTRDDAGFHFEIEIDGVPAYRSEPDMTVYHFEWIDHDRLAWYGWYEDKEGRTDRERGLQYFVNGQNLTGSFCFETFYPTRGCANLVVQENGVRYGLRDDGSRAWERPACCNDLISCHCRSDDGTDRRPVYPEELRGKAGGVQVVFNGATGEKFDCLENASGMLTYAFNADRSRVGYVGIRYAKWVGLLGKAAGPIFGRIIDSGEKNPLAWVVTLLFNPYFGPGTAAVEGSKRYYPVNHDQVWKNGYRFANDQFFTPADKLVVTAYTAMYRGKAMVVIDEDEGPQFDDIVNVRYLAAEGCVCYLGRDGDSIYRVTVKTE